MFLTSNNKPNVTRTHYPDSEAKRVWRYQREVIRIRKSKKDRQHNGQRKKNKGAFVKWNISIWDIYSVAVNQSLPLLHYSRGTKYQPIILSMDWLLNILFVFLYCFILIDLVHTNSAHSLAFIVFQRIKQTYTLKSILTSHYENETSLVKREYDTFLE